MVSVSVEKVGFRSEVVLVVFYHCGRPKWPLFGWKRWVLGLRWCWRYFITVEGLNGLCVGGKGGF